ncbi:MAG: phasin family protein [Methylocystis sp.]|uniref:phasin family protein n=1 Tax=Methylocystis sp. TaxID=1911079 RepID=UPI003D0FF795
MANPQNGSPKSKAPEAKRITPGAPEAEATPTTSESVKTELAPPPVEAPKPPVVQPPVVQAPSTALAVAVEIKSPGADAGEFDPALWSQKSIDLWAENATAFLDFAERLANAKTIDEVTTLQSRFMSERLDALLQQSTELMTLAQRLFSMTVTPVYGARAA